MLGTLSAAGLLGFAVSLPAQVLVLDRGSPDPLAPTSGRYRIGWTKDDQSIVGDDFKIGREGEVWIIDNIRTWVVLEADPGHPHFPANLYESFTLYGGLASEPAANNPAGPECACHGLVALKTTSLPGGRSLPQTSDVSLAFVNEGQNEGDSRTFALWQIDFRNLRWSVPGGVSIQFAMKGVGRDLLGPNPPLWFNSASPIQENHRLRVFDKTGMLTSFFDVDGQIQDKSTGINIQVWAHRMAQVAVYRKGAIFEVILHGGATFEISEVDLKSLRFGPNDASATKISRLDVDGDGYFDLRLSFPVEGSGISTGNMSACLNGRRLDKVPFEGCDLARAANGR